MRERGLAALSGHIEAEARVGHHQEFEFQLGNYWMLADRVNMCRIEGFKVFT